METADIEESLAEEQAEIDKIYARLDELRIDLYTKISKLKKDSSASTHQNRSERDSTIAALSEQLHTLNSVDKKLVFGKLEYKSAPPKYIGRIGILDEEKTPILFDWRAEISRDFYQATALNPGDITLRRHISTKDRKVTSLEDEAFTAEASEGHILSGEGAIFQSLTARRTNRMNDIVATIQKEQDSIIRSADNKVLVVQGGAGTGKTAVALHRAAYLLYSKKEQLAKRGVLLIGPNDKFLFYIDKVLPSLGESGVVSSAIQSLYPGIRAEIDEHPIAQRIKGDIKMAAAIKKAVDMYVRIPKETVSFSVEGAELQIRPEDIKFAQTRTLEQQLPHNEGRAMFVKFIVDLLAESFLQASGMDSGVDGTDQAAVDFRKSEIKQSLLSTREVIRTLNYSWMQLLPQRFIKDLFSNEKLISLCMPWVKDSEIKFLIRHPDQAFSKFDIPLLDEAAELIGESPVSESSSEADSTGMTMINEVLERMKASGNESVGIVDPEVLYSLERNVSQNSLTSRAQNDRTWVYGHVIVDEAQELSQMDWRMLLRRCPSKSFTIVGDIAQTTSPAGARSWDAALDATFKSDYRIEKLTVNYRNPKLVAEKAIAVAKSSGLDVDQIASPREIPNSFEINSVDVYEVYQTAARLAYELSNEFITFGSEGRVAVIVEQEKVHELKNAIFKFIEQDYGQVVADKIRTQKSPDAQLEIISPEDSKGLEFDAVLLVEPLDLQVFDSNGHQTYESMSQLYVAMTRPTSRLTVVHFKELPAGF